MSFNTPILFLIFNRPDTTRQVFKRIKEIEPKYLYVAADGPRSNKPEEIIQCNEVRQIATNIDWDCELKILFRESNLGCKIGVSTAINWFFENVEAGIIIEDDVLPDLSFFSYCEAMLSKYFDNDKVMHISGYNPLSKWKLSKNSYFTSYLGNIWGWATWRRAWNLYDVDINAWNNLAIQQNVLSYFPDFHRGYRKKLYDDLFENKINTWDYQWTFAKLMNQGLSITPTRNLVANIGMNNNATHASNPSLKSCKVFSIKSIKFKPNISPDLMFDKKYILKYYKSDSFSLKKYIRKMFRI